MSSYVLVFSNPMPGREEECNEWYNNVHLKEVAQAEGILWAQRFTLADAQLTDGEQPWKYLAIYEVDDAVGAANTVRNMLANAPTMNMSTSLDTDNAFVSVMTSLTGKVTA